MIIIIHYAIEITILLCYNIILNPNLANSSYHYENSFEQDIEGKIYVKLIAIIKSVSG